MKNNDALSREIKLTFFGRNITLGKNELKAIVPLCVVLVCIIITIILLCQSLSHVGNVDGTFVLYGSDSTFIKFDADGSYKTSSDLSGGGKWRFEGNKIILASEGGNEKASVFIEQKYIAPLDDTFLYGQIPQGSLFDAEVKNEKGDAYIFKTDGRVYTKDDGRNLEFGTYITDGHFIIITTKDNSITYLNCGDGITDTFYKAS